MSDPVLRTIVIGVVGTLLALALIGAVLFLQHGRRHDSSLGAQLDNFDDFMKELGHGRPTQPRKSERDVEPREGG